MDRYFKCFGLPGAFVLTVLMSLLALALMLLFPSAARVLCLGAMLFSSAGDVFMMRFRGLDRKISHCFEWGAGCFMAAHFLYTAAFALRIRQMGAAYLNGGAVLALSLCFLCLCVFAGLGLKKQNRPRLPLVLAYLFVISLNCVTIFSCAWSGAALRPLTVLSAVGAVSFMASDALIGLGMMTGITRYDPLIWWLYPIGQILILLGA